MTKGFQTALLVFFGAVGTVTATYLAFGVPPAVYVASAWVLFLAYVIERNP